MIRNLIILLFILGCQNPNNSTKKLNTTAKNVVIADTHKNLNIIRPLRVKAMTNDIDLEDTVEATIKDRHYTLYPDGKIAVRISAINQVDTFHLNTNLEIEEAHFLDYNDYLIIYYTTTDSESASSYIESYDKKTNKMKWKNEIFGFNLTDPIVIDNITYVAALDQIGKLNLDNGKYIWKHENLFEKLKFDGLESIEIEGDYVNFIQNPRMNDTKEPGRIIVNDNTGKIVKIIKNSP